MSFGREVDHDVVARDEPREQGGVTDIASSECVTRMLGHRLQVGAAACVGELVQHGDVDFPETGETLSEQHADVI